MYSDFTSASARHNMAAEQQHNFLVCRAFVRTVFVVNTWPYNYDIWYIFSVFVFGIELEAQLSHYETHCSERFLLKSLLTGRRRDVAIRPDDSNSGLKSLLLLILFSS